MYDVSRGESFLASCSFSGAPAILGYWLHSSRLCPCLPMASFLCVSHSVMPNSLQPHGLSLTRLLCPWNSPGKNTGVGCHSLLQGIFLTQGSNPCLLHCRQMLYPLSPQPRACICYPCLIWNDLYTFFTIPKLGIFEG